MAQINPNIAASQPLMPQGWPLTSMAGEGKLGPTIAAANAPAAATAKTTALAQSGHSNDRIV